MFYAGNYKACIFDFDFTLCDASEGIIKSYNDSFEAFGMERRPDDVIKKTIGMHVKDSFTLMSSVSDPAMRDAFYEKFVSVADTCMTGMTKPLPGALELLASLHEKGIRTAIVSTKLARRIIEYFEKAGVSGFTDLIIGGEDVKFPKPDPEGLLLAVAKLGLSKSDCLYVGDSCIDAKTAEAAGVDFAAVTTGTTCADDFSKYSCKAVLDGVYELYV